LRMSRWNEPMSMAISLQRMSKACLPDEMRSPVTGSCFLLVKRSVNWLPLSVSSLTIVTGQAAARA